MTQLSKEKQKRRRRCGECEELVEPMLLGFIDKEAHLVISPCAFEFRYNNKENADIFGTAIKEC